MPELSKTAKAAMKAGADKNGPKKLIPDHELVRVMRIDVAAGLYPTAQCAAALLRLYDDNADLLLTVRRLAIEVEDEKENLISLDQTATALECSRDAAEAELKSLRDDFEAMKLRALAAETSLQTLTLELDGFKKTMSSAFEELDPKVLLLGSTDEQDNRSKE
jgi:hypothetical protein